MKQKRFYLLRRFSGVIFSLITVLGLLFISITYLSTTNYHQASTQLLNKDVARHVAEFTAAFTSAGINKKKADSVFKTAMIMNPNTEVYFLDSTGRVIYFEADEKEIKERKVALEPIRKYIAASGEEYIKGVDPKDPAHQKIFSAAEVESKDKTTGYIYIILGSEKSDGIMELLFGSHILNLAIKAFIVIILLSLLVSALYLRRVRKYFGQTTAVLERFENGDYDARFAVKPQDEMEPVTHAFNKMADLLSSSISKLTKSEAERKSFIATISHDLRTPLSIARGYTETLMLKREKGDVTPEEEEQYAQLIYAKMLQIENMVKQLFELSKMEAVEFAPQKEPFVLSEIVQESIANFQLIACQKKIELKCTQCLYHVWINADISMMERVVQNVVDNAVKSTPEAGFAHCCIIVEEGDIIFKIENTGDALPDDLVKWINQNKGESALFTRRPAKFGLGLLIVQKILHLHNSSLETYRSNNTNIFMFRLPIYNPAA